MQIGTRHDDGTVAKPFGFQGRIIYYDAVETMVTMGDGGRENVSVSSQLCYRHDLIINILRANLPDSMADDRERDFVCLIIHIIIYQAAVAFDLLLCSRNNITRTIL